MGEIQKAYNALAGVLKRESDESYEIVERLRTGPVAMAKDREWDAFVEHNEHFVDPRLPVRRVQNITYPGKDHPAAAEVRSGMLERKSKYLKSYTPGWYVDLSPTRAMYLTDLLRYVLSPTHLHEFKSPDRISSQVPVMSLQLAEQKLGSHSGTDSSSHKFMLKGRQSGGMHRGHSWVFRAESHDTMLAWFEDLKNLTEKTGEERKAFIRRHARSLSGGSQKAPSISSEGMEEDEADQVPYSATASQVDQSQPKEKLPERPKPGGRFPSTLNIDRDSQVPLSPSSPSSSGDRDAVAAAGALPGSDIPFGASDDQVKGGGYETHAGTIGESTDSVALPATYVPSDPKRQAQYIPDGQDPVSSASWGNEASSSNVRSREPSQMPPKASPFPMQVERHDSKYGDWMAPAAGGAAAGALGAEAYRRREQQKEQMQETRSSVMLPIEPQAPSASSVDTPKLEDLAAPPEPTVAKMAPSTVPSSQQPPAAVAPMTGTEYLTNPTEAQGISSEGPGAVSYGDPSTVQQAQEQQEPARQNVFMPISSQKEYNGLPVQQGPSPTSLFTSNASALTDPAAPVKALANDPDFVPPTRPTLETHTSVATISELHIPGEFPPTPAASGPPS